MSASAVVVANWSASVDESDDKLVVANDAVSFKVQSVRGVSDVVVGLVFWASRAHARARALLCRVFVF